ncbi:universal stress protein [Actinomadura barringtoniae]|uniref:Universal stress protein n=2 Tax=Actinomadura barringtoniae TaxID=1427535 RepID=A0A939T8R9_9ACTN|nr:universal stress protein [Actinomadura barringtoniae]
MDSRSNVVVGYDETEESGFALRWAAAEARLRMLDLVVCHCWRLPYSRHALGPEIDLEPIVQRMGGRLLKRGVARAQALEPSLTVRGRLMAAPAYEALMDKSHDAALIVVGSHENDSLPVGSTALQLPAHAQTPTVIVRRASARYRRVVVGVDESPGSAEALAFAFEEAALHRTRLQVVCGWEAAAGGAGGEAARDEVEPGSAWEARIERAVAPWAEKFPDVEFSKSLILKDPRDALLEASETAGLVVVGDRGNGGVRGLLLGATSLAIIHHARCTVAVVHERRTPR